MNQQSDQTNNSNAIWAVSILAYEFVEVNNSSCDFYNIVPN